MHRCSSGTVAAAVVVVAFAAFAAAVFKADSIREAKETARSAYTHTLFCALLENALCVWYSIKQQKMRV